MHKIDELSDDAINQFSEEVARYAYQKSLDERNMIGIVYLEDMEKCRTPSAESIDASAFNTVSTNGMQGAVASEVSQLRADVQRSVD